MSFWRREDRAEAERNKELERLSKEMDEPGFWDRVSETLATASARDLARFADTSAPRSMPTGASLNDYIQRVRASTYPTPDCLEATAIPRVVVSGPTPEEVVHLEQCKYCSRLVQAAMLSAEERADLLASIKDATGQYQPDPAWAPVEAQILDELEAKAEVFAEKHPDEPPVVVVDDHNEVDLRQLQESVDRLRRLYRNIETKLVAKHVPPITRIVILKDGVEHYDQQEWALLRRAIQSPIGGVTYLVSRRMLGGARRPLCSVVAEDLCLQLRSSKAGPEGATPSLVQDKASVVEVRRLAREARQRGMTVSNRGRINPKLTWALELESNDRLKEVLEEAMSG